MESVLNKLQRIEDLRVISRTSVEAYRNTDKTIPEIADELDVTYFVEGSGQKIGDQILLSIQLIEAETDQHIWAEQYQREVTDIFNLQNEIALLIASKVEASITPEEQKEIGKSPTDNLVAYDLFLQGLELLYAFDEELLDDAIGFFREAVAEDPQFARAYAAIAISYYYKDAGQAYKRYSDTINYYADQTLLHDNTLAQSLIAKALFYMNSSAYDMAVPYFEKALEHNPNSALVVGFLADVYVNHLPDTRKYLEYALKGVQLGLATNDSSTISLNYLHLANALIQTGFVDEAEFYIDRSLAYNPENIFSDYVRAYILFAQDKNFEKLSERLLRTFRKDTTRLDVLQEVAKSFYFRRDFETAYRYYKPFLAVKEMYKLDIYPAEDAKMAVVYDNIGDTLKGTELMETFRRFGEADESIYKHLNLTAYYAYTDEPDRALEEFEKFAVQENFQYWIILLIEDEPLIENIKDRPEFKRILKQLKANFWNKHKEIKTDLQQQGLL